MVGGGRRSPSRHPTRSGVGRVVDGGRRLEDRVVKADGGSKVVDGSFSGADGVSSGGIPGERRFSFVGSGGLADIGAEGKRLLYVRLPVKAGQVATGKVVGQDAISSEELDIESAIKDQGIVDRDMSLQDSSDLDEIMEIQGGCEEVGSPTAMLERNESSFLMKENSEPDTLGFASCVGVDLGKDSQMDSDEMNTSSMKRIEVSRILHNPIFEPKKEQFTFGGMGRVGDLRSEVLCRNDKDVDSKFDLKLQNAQVMKGEGLVHDCNDFLNTSGRTPSICGNVSLKGSSSQKQQVPDPEPSSSVKREFVDNGAATNAWKKSLPIKLRLSEEVGSFLREDGLVNLDLDKARENIQKLNMALIGSLLGRRLPFWVVQNDLQRKWGHLGLTRITPMGSDCFLCWFENMEARNNVLIGGSWYVAGQIIEVDQWTTGLSSK